MIIPYYFVNKIEQQVPHKFGQVNDVVMMKTHPYLLYRLPNGETVYGGDASHLKTKPHGGSWAILLWNPKEQVWEQGLGRDDKDWVFSQTKLDRYTKEEFLKIEFDLTCGWLSFNILGWLHKNVSDLCILDDFFSYEYKVKILEKVFDLTDEIGHTIRQVKNGSIIFDREDDFYSCRNRLEDYFRGVKIPTESSKVYDKIQSGDLTKEDFLKWIRGA